MMVSVIVIDDDKDIVRLFSELLEENGINVIGKGYNGKDAISLFKENKPDACLIDIMMPNGNGFYAIKAIKKIDPTAKIIAVTADMNSLTQEKSNKLSIPIIYKPFNIENVIFTIMH
ncbi:MAG: response regulator [Nitrosopumilus sp.]|nr:response regulator [Nitrosopumilus sp.]